MSEKKYRPTGTDWCSQRFTTSHRKCSHRQLPTKMADIRRDWLPDQNTDCCFVVIGLVQDIPQSFALHLKIDPGG